MFAESAVKADALGVATVEGFSSQKVSLSVQKHLDGKLAAGEQREIQTRLRSLRLQMPELAVDTIGSESR